MGIAERKYLFLGRGNPKITRISNGLTLLSKQVGCSICSEQNNRNCLRNSQHCPVWISAVDWDTGAEGRQRGWKRGKKQFSWGQTQLFKIWLFNTSFISRERRQPCLSPCLECIACLQLGDEGDRFCPIPHIPFNWGKTGTEPGIRHGSGVCGGLLPGNMGQLEMLLASTASSCSPCAGPVMVTGVGMGELYTVFSPA